MVSGRPVAVIVVEPLPVVRAALARMIDQARIHVVGEAATADEALGVIEAAPRGDVGVLVGLGLEGEHDSYWLIRAIRERFPDVSVVACGARADPLSISHALFAGADAFLDKSSDPAEFIDSLRSGIEGEMALAGPPTEWVGEIAEGIDRRRLVETVLTDREREVLTAAAEGLTARQIASRLGMRERTVTTHFSRIYAKLGVGTRVAAVRVAAAAGLVSVGTPE